MLLGDFNASRVVNDNKIWGDVMGQYRVCCKCNSNGFRMELIATRRVRHCKGMECPCGTGVQDVHHLLQRCPLYNEQRRLCWPEEVEMSQKLWGPSDQLRKTTEYIEATTLQI